MAKGRIEKNSARIGKTREAVANTLKIFTQTIDDLKAHKVALESHATEHEEVAASLTKEAQDLRNEADSIDTVLSNLNALLTKK